MSAFWNANGVHSFDFFVTFNSWTEQTNLHRVQRGQVGPRSTKVWPKKRYRVLSRFELVVSPPSPLPAHDGQQVRAGGETPISIGLVSRGVNR
jgi:hypothetical protein